MSRHLSPNRRTLKQRVLVGLGVTLTALCLLAAVGVGYAYIRFNSITRYDVDLPPAAEGEPQNFLLVGSDSREGLDPNDPDYGGFVDATSPTGGLRTDTIMILRVDPDTEEADLLSLPRDLYVPIGGPDGRKDRINAAYSDSRQTLIDTIQQSLGIPVHHYVEVSFAGFKDLVEAIGGVNVYFDAPLRDPNTGLDVGQTGCLTLDSVEALQFVRARHLEIQQSNGRWVTDPSGDLGRISRQQLFIRQAIGRALSKGLSNPVTLNELVGVGVDNVGLDPGLGVQDLLAFGRRFAAFDEDTLRTHTLEVVPFRTGGGAAVLGIDDELSEPVLNIFRGLPPGAVSPRFIEVTVLNGTDRGGLATDTAAALGQIGFTIEVIGDTPEPFPRTALYYAPGSETSALQVVQHLTSRAELIADPTLDDHEVVIVTGPDFTTVHEQPSTEDLSQLLPTPTSSSAPPAGDGSSGDGAAAPTGPTTPTTEPTGYTPDRDPALDCR